MMASKSEPDVTVGSGVPIWEHQAPQRRASPGLGRDGIVTIAIAIADEEGLDGLTIRRVAERLGSSPMSLYRHVPSKEDLLDLMLDNVTGEQDIEGLRGVSWQSGLTALAREQRRVTLEHPWSIIPPARPLLGPNGMRRFELALALFNDTDLAIEHRAWAIGVIDAFVRGSVSAELAARNERIRSGLTTQQWQKAVEPYVTRMLATGEYPMAAKYMADVTISDPVGAFEDGVRVVLSGINSALG